MNISSTLGVLGILLGMVFFVLLCIYLRNEVKKHKKEILLITIVVIGSMLIIGAYKQGSLNQRTFEGVAVNNLESRIIELERETKITTPDGKVIPINQVLIELINNLQQNATE